MATYLFDGYPDGAIDFDGGLTAFPNNGTAVGKTFRIEPSFDSDTDRYRYEINDDDTAFSGDASADEAGDDTNQYGIVRDAFGNVVGGGASSKIYLEHAYTVTDGLGNTINIYTVEIGGQPVGIIADGPLQPGTTYTVTSASSVTSSNAPAYSNFGAVTYDPDDPNAIQGGTKGDSLSGGSGNDTIHADAGDDTVHGGAGDDYAELGAGNDSYGGYDDLGNDTVYGGDGDDTINGGDGDDELHGGAGDDHLTGGSDNDTLYGDDGSDWFSIGDDHEQTTIFGGEGGSDYDGIGFYNWLSTNGINVTFTGSEQGTFDFGDGYASGIFSEIEMIWGTAYDDYIDASASTVHQQLAGNAGDDTIIGGSGGDTINSGAGDDLVQAGAGDDTIWTDGGTDTIEGGTGSDSIYVTTAGTDIIITGGEDTGDGDQDEIDFVTDDDGTDGDGYTVIFTGNEAGTFANTDNSITGTFTQIEAIEGSNDSDLIDVSATTQGVYLDGDGGDDTIIGGSGDDTLQGEAGDDLITTGAGYDTIRIDRFGGNDTITDFNLGDANGDGRYDDQIDVSALTGGTGPGGAIRWSDVTVTDDGFGNARLTFPEGETLVLQGVSPAQMSGPHQMQRAGIPCFTAGTLIDTGSGARPVEALRPGDRVQTRDNGVRRVLWVADRSLSRSELAANPRLMPVHIAAGALGNARDLTVSPQHALLMGHGAEEHLVRATHLARSTWGKVRWARGKRRVRYVHIMLDTHEILHTEGMWSESFFPGPWALATLAPGHILDLLRLGLMVPGATQARPVVRSGGAQPGLQPRQDLVDLGLGDDQRR